MFLLSFYVASTTALSGDQEFWRQFRKTDGLGETASYHLSMSNNQVIWVCHQESGRISRSDGYPFEGPGGALFKFYNDPEKGIYRLYEENGQIWSLIQGGVRVIVKFDRNIYPFPIAAMNEDLAANPSKMYRTALSPFPMIPYENNRSLILLSDDLLNFNVGDESTLSLLSGSKLTHQNLFGMGRSPRDNSRLWLAGKNGITLLSFSESFSEKPYEITEYPLPEGFQLSESSVFENDTRIVTALAVSVSDGRDFFAHFDLKAQNWILQSLPESLSLSYCWPGIDNEILAWNENPGEASLIRFPNRTNSDYTPEEVVLSRCFDVVRYEGGRFFLAGPEGVFHYAPPIWRKPAELKDIRLSFRKIIEDLSNPGNPIIWGINPSSLIRFQEGEVKIFPLPQEMTRGIQSPHLHLSIIRKILMIGVEDRLFSFHTIQEEFEVIRSTRCRAIGTSGSDLVVQSFPEGLPPGSYHIEFYNGTSFLPYASIEEDSGELPQLDFFYQNDPEGSEIWLGGTDGIRLVKDGQAMVFGGAGTAMLDENGASTILQLDDDRLWWGGLNQIIEYTDGIWNPIRAEEFDTVYDLELGEEEDVWVATGSGLFRYFSESWISNAAPEGLDATAVYCLLRDGSVRLWAGTSNGIYRYYPEADLDEPSMKIDEESSSKRISRDSSQQIGFQGMDRWQQTRAHRLLYRYQIDNQNWNSFFEAKNNTISFAFMEPGRHQINFQVMDRNGNIQTGFTSHEFEIILPWHEDFRLTVIVGFGGMMMLFFIGLSYRKHHQLVHSYSQVEQKVTERTHELERANQALLHSQKMQALGTLAAGIAHDFNNILSIIKGSAQLIENDPDQSIKAKTRLNRINTVVDQGTTLVQSLLGFCRSDPTHTTDLDLEKIIRDTVNLLGDRYLHKVDIVFDIPSDLMTVRSSKDLIQQILLNLVMNAVDSIKDRGCITFQAENLNKLPEDMVWRPLSTPPYVLISIADTGGGIASDIRPRIFEPFFTTKSFSTRRGTGLGLSMVYKLAEEMDIGIVVQSEIGKGSTFSIVIPRSSDTASNQISS